LGVTDQQEEFTSRANQLQSLRPMLMGAIQAGTTTGMVLQATASSNHEKIFFRFRAGCANPELAFQAHHNPAMITFAFTGTINHPSTCFVMQSNPKPLQGPFSLFRRDGSALCHQFSISCHETGCHINSFPSSDAAVIRNFQNL
jgi:hypothetical protein